MYLRYSLDGVFCEREEFIPDPEERDEQNCYPAYYSKIGIPSFDVEEGGSFILQ